jgi:hypothetical protein
METNSNNARRRLAKGIFAAPMIWTIPSGAHAAASSNLRCLANQTMNPNPAASVTSTVDGFVRIQAYADSYGQFYISGNSFGPYRSIDSNLPGLGQWARIDITTGRIDEILFQTPQGVSPVGRYVAVRFDTKGHIISIGQDTGTMASQSCWASVMPTIGG